VLAAVAAAGSALVHAAPSLLADRDVVLAAVAAPALVGVAVPSGGALLQYASEELRVPRRRTIEL
jgi:hypothetical protein